MKKTLRVLILAVAVFGLVGCVSVVRTQQARRQSKVSSWNRVDENQILLVGSIDASIENLDWGRADDEWVVDILPYVESFNADTRPRDVFQVRFVDRGDEFRLAAVASQQVVIYQPRIGGETNRFFEGRTIVHSLRLPTILVDVPQDARAVYVGELYFEVNEFGRIVDVSIDNRLDVARNQFYERFGNEIPLVPGVVRLLTPDEADSFQRSLQTLF